MVDKRIFNDFAINDADIEQQVQDALGTNDEADMVVMIEKQSVTLSRDPFLKGPLSIISVMMLLLKSD